VATAAVSTNVMVFSNMTLCTSITNDIKYTSQTQQNLLLSTRSSE